MTIVINGRAQDVVLSYAEVVSRAGKDPGRVYTVVWRSGTGNFSGTLAPGESVLVYEGSVFSVSETMLTADPDEVTVNDHPKGSA